MGFSINFVLFVAAIAFLATVLTPFSLAQHLKSTIRVASVTNEEGLNEGDSSRNLKLPEHAHEVHCSRERSRAAWSITEEYMMPFVERENYEISRSCRLHRDNDLFRDQEEHKVHVETDEWRCGYCKKSFSSEKFLDQHLENRHFNL